MWPPTSPSALFKYLCPQVAKSREKSLIGGLCNILKTEVCKTEVWPDPRKILQENPRQNPEKLETTQSLILGCTPRGSCNNTLLRRVLRRFFKEVLLRRALRRRLVRISAGTEVLRRVLRRERFIEGA